MLTKLLLFFHKYLVKALQGQGCYLWEKLQDLPEGTRYIVSGMTPANYFNSQRPVWLARADDMDMPMICHDSNKVEHHAVMLMSYEFEQRLGLGDMVSHVGDKLIMVEKTKVDYSKAAPTRVAFKLTH
jgi:hypothetical protein